MSKVEKILYVADADAANNNKMLDEALKLFQEMGIRSFDDPKGSVVAWYECKEMVGDFEPGTRLLVVNVDDDEILDEEDLFTGAVELGDEDEMLFAELPEEEEEFIEEFTLASLDEEEELFDAIAEGLVTRTPISIKAYPDYLRNYVEKFWANILSQTKGFTYTSLEDNEWDVVLQIIRDEAKNINRCFALQQVETEDEDFVRYQLLLDGVSLGTALKKEDTTMLIWRSLDSEYEKNEFCKELNWSGKLKDGLIAEIEEEIELTLETIREEKDYALFLSEMGELESKLYRVQKEYGVSPKRDMFKALAANQVDLIKEILAFKNGR
ncbi:hypothetical protein [Eubacterium oxidoreducens]|uniref:Uncharacterized protein n=1 Tax=Eubacterium oxidoreducens TaxID=1732 RepID=A0A1G6CIR5_EUBOX|nr:hypothetical protein [Eubacterium oxidoreducens]SDB32760.1 hypothetical protein SAMN02910417_02430 [Eubacterium oxidoreducens]